MQITNFFFSRFLSNQFIKSLIKKMKYIFKIYSNTGASSLANLQVTNYDILSGFLLKNKNYYN